MPLSLRSTLRLNNGRALPVLGLGVWQAGTGPRVVRAVTTALATGYRLIDTAKLYGNEAEVGEAVRRGPVPREEVFVTTKLWNDDHGRAKAKRAFDASLRQLGLEYLDLYLIHWPGTGERNETWKALAEIAQEARCRSIGVSNFTIGHLEELARASDVVPAVNQVELHPFHFQRELIEYCHRHGIQVQAYSPLARANYLDEATVTAVADMHGRSPAQVMLRWSLQHGLSAIPKSTHDERIRENAALFDFELTSGEMARLDGLSSGARVAWDPTTVP
ncbi:MAG: aldo/keto reductase [Thermoplasmata archaeon]|nr:aldo/keto reductase [Thermoplasmata archaeon]